MKKILRLTVGLVALMAGIAAHGEVQSLRGMPIDATNKAQELKPVKRDDQLIRRDFVQQPPLIPHNIEGYDISLRSNKCLTCHSWANYKEKGATKISITHFRDRDGGELSNVAGTRYFCNQCHVPQANAAPLVENEFKPVDALR